MHVQGKWPKAVNEQGKAAKVNEPCSHFAAPDPTVKQDLDWAAALLDRGHHLGKGFDRAERPVDLPPRGAVWGQCVAIVVLRKGHSTRGGGRGISEPAGRHGWTRRLRPRPRTPTRSGGHCV